jgi:CubicO group peptidase (beta-lactamase class C family)
MVSQEFESDGPPERTMLDDRFHAGSCTKAMVATLVAMLVEEGRLNCIPTLA